MCFLKFSCFYYKREAYDRGTSLTTGKCNLSYSQLSSQINQETVTLLAGKVWGQKQAGGRRAWQKLSSSGTTELQVHTHRQGVDRHRASRKCTRLWCLELGAMKVISMLCKWLFTFLLIINRHILGLPLWEWWEWRCRCWLGLEREE